MHHVKSASKARLTSMSSSTSFRITVYSTYTETAAASTTFITTRYTCPTRNDGTFPGASTVNALNHFTCYYPDNGECVYANGGAGQLIADVSCLTCPYQMTGAPASGYNHAATIDLTSNLGTSFYVCPSTDIDTSGTVLYNSYMDPSTNAVLCEYGSPSGTTPISQLKSCAYDRGSGSLVSPSLAASSAFSCRACLLTHPFPMLPLSLLAVNSSLSLA